VGAVLPAARDCTSAADNDCNGAPDNTVDATCACAQGATQACGGVPAANIGKGPCKAGTQSCVLAASKSSSAWGACAGAVGPAAKDACDLGNDANCNGVANEGCQCINTQTESCGVCGSATCAAGAWGTCAQPAFAVGELKWPAPNAPSTGLPNPELYDSSSAAIVVDKVTGLNWQRTVPVNSYTLADATTYCASLILATQGGWRVPSVIELQSIADDEAADPTNMIPAIDAAAFPNTPDETFWTSTPVAGVPGTQWGVEFETGTMGQLIAGSTARLRCVR
jgi:hypothetical protein